MIASTVTLIGCNATSQDNSSQQEEQAQTPEAEVKIKEQPNLFITPLTLGKELSQVSPYIMFNYRLQKSEHPAYIFTTSYEEMEYDGDNLIVGVMFISNGDLQEPPLAFYIYGEKHPDFITSVTFCIHEDETTNERVKKFSIFASHSCVFDAQAKAGSIEVIYKADETLLINQKKYKYDYDRFKFSSPQK
jgi:hypothetical protein